MRIYPHDADGRVTETWEASKWLHDTPNHVLTPMFRKGGQRFFVNEVTQCSDGSLFIPERLYTRDNTGSSSNELEMWCLGRAVRYSPEGWIVDQNCSSLCSKLFVKTFPELDQSRFAPSMWSSSAREWSKRMPHPLREIS